MTPDVAAAWAAIAFLRADPRLLDDIRPTLEDVARTLNGIDLDALPDDERAAWIATASQLYGMATLVALVDEPDDVNARRLLDHLFASDREH